MPPTPLQHCFVIMSFSGSTELERAYKLGMSPIIRKLGFNCIRADEAPSLRSVTAEIERSIQGAYFVVADLTGERQNCFYEVGYAHGLDKPVILVAKTGTPLHFDLSHYPFIFYDSEKALRRQLGNRIRNVVLRSPERDRDVDPQNGKFGRLALDNGRLLTARVLRAYEDGDGDDVCDIRIDVIPLPGKPGIKGEVHFHVHPSYTPRGYRIRADDGYASLELESVAGAFTVGAETDGGKTRLELDLAGLPGAPRSFYA